MRVRVRVKGEWLRPRSTYQVGGVGEASGRASGRTAAAEAAAFGTAAKCEVVRFTAPFTAPCLTMEVLSEVTPTRGACVEDDGRHNQARHEERDAGR